MVKNMGFMVLLAIFCLACDGESFCEEGYVPQYGPDNSNWCIPEYEEGVVNDFNLGSSYFHQKHGFISYNDGIWTKIRNQVITP